VALRARLESSHHLRKEIGRPNGFTTFGRQTFGRQGSYSFWLKQPWLWSTQQLTDGRVFFSVSTKCYSTKWRGTDTLASRINQLPVSSTSGLYYKNIRIVNDTSRVIRSDAPSCGITIILTTLEVSFMVIENIYSTGVPHDDCHLQSLYFYSTGHLWQPGSQVG
jgi:hypothetical protein